MRVNDLPIPEALAKAALGNEKLVQNIGSDAQINVSTTTKAETVAQTIAKLENQLFQLFFENGLQLGQIVTQLSALQSQELTDASGTQNSVYQNTITKLLDSLKALFISPQENTIQNGPGANRIQQCLVSFFDELVIIKQNANPGIQANIDKFITQILRSLPDLKAFLVQNGYKDLILTGQEDNQSNLHGSRQPNSTAEDANGQLTKAGTTVNADNIAKYNLADISSNNPQKMEQLGLLMTDQAEQTALPNFKQPPQNATVLQQKIYLLAEHLSGQFAGEKVPVELSELLGKLSNSLKELAIDPVSQWERLLRYPIIYKQVLQRVTKLLQEFLNSKQTIDPALRQSLIDILSETTASLHVQLSVNQLDQENPAKQQLYFQIPLQVGAEVKTGELYIIHEREKRGNKWNLTSSWYRFYLETQFIGPVDVSIQALAKQLTIKLTVTSEEQAVIFNQQRTTLRKILTDSGYDVIDIACGVGKVDFIYPFVKDNIQMQRVNVLI